MLLLALAATLMAAAEGGAGKLSPAATSARTGILCCVVASSDTDTVLPIPLHALAPGGQGARLGTSLAYRFGRTGLVGALGYNHAAYSPLLNPHEVNSAVGAQPDGPSSTLGVKVSLPF